MSRADLLLADALIHAPGETFEGWLAIADGVISDMGTAHPPNALSTVRCDGKWLLPGLVDLHVHFRDPGFERKEDFASGSAAAAAGGVTTVIDMPNTGSLVMTPDDVREKLDHVRGRSFVDFGVYTLLVDSASFVEEFAALGVAGFKWLLGYPSLHGRASVPSSLRSLRDSLARAGDRGLLIGVHAENPAWIQELEGELKEEGRTDPHAHGASRPPFVEALGVAEATILAHEAGCRLHIHHLSSETGLRTATGLRKALNAAVTLETCPHYLFLTEDDLSRLGNAGRVNPPLRGPADALALWDGLVDGEIEAIASDHAPHTPDEKSEASVWQVPSGLIGVETIFPLVFNAVRSGRLSMERFLSATAQRPAEIAGLGDRKGKLIPGYDADVLVVDPDAHTSVSSERLHSKHKNSPFEGFQCQGAIQHVLLRGHMVLEDGRLAGVPTGRHVPSRYPAGSGRPSPHKADRLRDTLVAQR